MDQRFEAVIERKMAAPAPLIWAVLADTNRWDRNAGASPTTYVYGAREAGEEPWRTRIGHGQLMGAAVEWTEWGEWVEGRFLVGERHYRAGPIPLAGLRVDVSAIGGGANVCMKAYVSGEGLPPALGAALERRFAAALDRYLSAVEALVGRALEGLELGEARLGGSPIVLARELLLRVPPLEVVSGRITPSAEDALGFRAERFAEAPVAPALRRCIVDLLRTRADQELADVRPAEIARAFGHDRGDVLRALLYATQAGLFDLRWQIDCPSCRVSAGSVGALAALGRLVHCDSCNIAYDLDFGEHVQAIFQVNPAIRHVTSETYCGGSPWWRPHVLLRRLVPAGGTIELEAGLDTRGLIARVQRHALERSIELPDGPPEALRVQLRPTGIEAEASGRAAGATSRVVFSNAGDEDVVVQLERAVVDGEPARGSEVVAMPEFLDLFSTDAPAAGVDLSVGTLTVLFSDLTDSTAMYRRLGDARAFALVEEHFRDMHAVIARHGGALVKTMGDAVMATFVSASGAVAAAFDMVARVQAAAEAHGQAGYALKVGLHEGACLAVRANGRLDFFGTTVNLAARMVSHADANQIVLCRALLEGPDIARLIFERGGAMLPTLAYFKGIEDAQELVVINTIDRSTG